MPDEFLLQEQRMQRAQIMEELPQWLMTKFSPSSLFLTFTFRDPVPYRRIQTVMRSMHLTLWALRGNELLPPELRMRFPRLFLAAEPHLSKAFHVHGLWDEALLSSEKDTAWLRRSIYDKMFMTYGRALVKPVRSLGGVASYSTKYVTKHFGEWLIA